MSLSLCRDGGRGKTAHFTTYIRLCILIMRIFSTPFLTHLLVCTSFQKNPSKRNRCNLTAFPDFKKACMSLKKMIFIVSVSLLGVYVYSIRTSHTSPGLQFQTPGNSWGPLVKCLKIITVFGIMKCSKKCLKRLRRPTEMSSSLFSK